MRTGVVLVRCEDKEGLVDLSDDVTVERSVIQLSYSCVIARRNRWANLELKEAGSLDVSGVGWICRDISGDNFTGMLTVGYWSVRLLFCPKSPQP